MKVIGKTVVGSGRVYYEKHLRIINALLPIEMTPKEMEVLGCFMYLEESLGGLAFSVGGRKRVKEELGLSSAGLSNYLSQLREKGFIVSRGDVYDILGILRPELGEQRYQFKIIRDDEQRVD